MLLDILKCNYYVSPMNLGRATHNRALRSEGEYYGHNDLSSLLLPKGRPTRMLALPKTYKAAAETMSDTWDVLAPASRSESLRINLLPLIPPTTQLADSFLRALPKGLGISPTCWISP